MDRPVVVLGVRIPVCISYPYAGSVRKNLSEVPTSVPILESLEPVSTPESESPLRPFPSTIAGFAPDRRQAAVDLGNVLPTPPGQSARRLRLGKADAASEPSRLQAALVHAPILRSKPAQNLYNRAHGATSWYRAKHPPGVLPWCFRVRSLARTHAVHAYGMDGARRLEGQHSVNCPDV